MHLMTVMIVTDRSQVVGAAKAIVERRDDWTKDQEVVFVALMARFAGYGYLVGRIQDHFSLFRRLWDCFYRITPGSLSYDQAFLMITTSDEFISAGL